MFSLLLRRTFSPSVVPSLPRDCWTSSSLLRRLEPSAPSSFLITVASSFSSYVLSRSMGWCTRSSSSIFPKTIDSCWSGRSLGRGKTDRTNQACKLVASTPTDRKIHAFLMFELFVELVPAHMNIFICGLRLIKL